MKRKISIKGRELLRNPSLNKGTAFNREERDLFGLHGLLPDHISTMDEQLKRRYENFKSTSSRIDKYMFLSNLQNRNETLFYRLVEEHVDEMLPYIYTPAVGDASLDFSHLYNQSRGLYISCLMEDHIETILENNKSDDIKVIVVTDGGRILGLGDVGIGGMVIPIGKTALYSLFGGINPTQTLPIFLDVGCNTPKITEDPLYIGLKQRRISEENYYTFVEKFVAAVKKVYPNVLLQWEDFSRAHAFPLLEKYRENICSFNDDIQGTASVTLAAILSALKKKEESIESQKICILGAGSAGLGIARLLVLYMVRSGIPEEEARRKIYFVDRNGLIHDAQTHLTDDQMPFARPFNEVSFWNEGDKSIDLRTVVENASITTLIGVSTKKGAFDKEVVTQMAKNTARPIIFPLSNPNSKSEALPVDLYKWTEGKVIVATGSPYSPIEHEGRTFKVEQCNNVFIFPAFGLANATLRLKAITEEMFVIAAEALSGKALPFLFPSLKDLRPTTQDVAEAILEYAIRHGLAEPPRTGTIREAIQATLWHAEYNPYEPHESE